VEAGKRPRSNTRPNTRAKETLEGNIGIKLSKKLAKAKDKGIYGDTEDPGPFKGGKKVEPEDPDKDKKKEK
jgi:hypothetical protein